VSEVDDVGDVHYAFRTLTSAERRWNDTRCLLVDRLRLLRVTFDDDDGVVGVDDDRVMRTAPLGVVSGAVVGVVTGCRSS